MDFHDSEKDIEEQLIWLRGKLSSREPAAQPRAGRLVRATGLRTRISVISPIRNPAVLCVGLLNR